nr:MAG TPA: hypothetical protein [Caudoviricetes sp.]
MTKKVADLSVFQGSSESYMKSLKSHGIDTTGDENDKKGC